MVGIDAVRIVTEFPLGQAAPGVERRAASLSDWVETCGLFAERISIHDMVGLSRFERTRMLRDRETTARLRGEQKPTIIVGLGGPHLLEFASKLSYSMPVAFDSCDSWNLQFMARARGGDPRLLVPTVLGQIALLRSSRELRYLYISDRDLAADGSLLRNRRGYVVPNRAPKELYRIPPVSGSVERFVIPVDAASFHNRRGLDQIAKAITRYRSAGGKLPIESYGPKPPAGLVSVGVRHMGFTPDIADVYSGATAVIATNGPGSGVPNKLIEAEAAGRPIIVHRSWASRYPKDRGNTISFYLTTNDIVKAMRNIEQRVVLTQTPAEKRVDGASVSDVFSANGNG